MANGCIAVGRILDKLDGYLHKKDYAAAERHLAFWAEEARGAEDIKTLLLVLNEQMGLYRKTGKREQATIAARDAISVIERKGLGELVGAATAFLNAATVYKAFGMAEEAIPLFAQARQVYERELEQDDDRLAGLYNNMGLAFVDVGRFDEANDLYEKALTIMEKKEKGAADAAVTHLNMASLAEARLGLEAAEAAVAACLARARTLLDGVEQRDGNYAFVCEKCASVFGYYGYFRYENELKERARRIYEGS